MCVSVYVHVFVRGCVHAAGGDIYPLVTLWGLSSLWTLGMFLSAGGRSFSPGYPDATLGVKFNMCYPTFLFSHTLISTRGKHRQEGISPPMTLSCTNITVRSVSLSLMHQVYGLPGMVRTKVCVRDGFIKCISQSRFNLFCLDA